MRTIVEAPLPALPSTVPEPLAVLVGRMMTRDPQARCTMAAAAEGWHRWLAEQPATDVMAPWTLATAGPIHVSSARADHEATEVVAPRPRSKHRWPVAVVACIVPMLWWMGSSKPTPAAEEPVIEVAPATDQGKPQQPAIVAAPEAPIVPALLEPTPPSVPPRKPKPVQLLPQVAQEPTVSSPVLAAPAGYFVPNRRPYVDIYIDGTKVGVSPLGSKRKPVAIAAGEHLIEFSDPATGAMVLRRQVMLAPGTTTLLE
jgi:hypothetical protein